MLFLLFLVVVERPRSVYVVFQRVVCRRVINKYIDWNQFHIDEYGCCGCNRKQPLFYSFALQLTARRQDADHGDVASLDSDFSFDILKDFLFCLGVIATALYFYSNTVLEVECTTCSHGVAQYTFVNRDVVVEYTTHHGFADEAGAYFVAEVLAKFLFLFLGGSLLNGSLKLCHLHLESGSVNLFGKFGFLLDKGNEVHVVDFARVLIAFQAFYSVFFLGGAA